MHKRNGLATDLTVGLVNAGIEIGFDGTSGIQGLEQAIRRGETSGLKSYLKSIGSEAREEVIQGLVSRGMGQMFGSGAKTFSLTDDNAVASVRLKPRGIISGYSTARCRLMNDWKAKEP